MTTDSWIRDFPEAVIRARAVSKAYGNRTALAALDLAVPEGAVYALVGPNGAGKSTTMRVLLDLTRRDAGELLVFGDDPAKRAGMRGRIGYVPERADWLHGGWKAGDAIRYHRLLFPRWDSGYALQLNRVLCVDESRYLSAFSKGEMRRLQLLLALATRPELLLLDEPTDGLDPVVRDEVWALLADFIGDTGATALISTHHVHEVERMASHYGAIRDGRVVAQLDTEELRARVREYRLAVSDSWLPPSALIGSALRRRRKGGGMIYTVIGEESHVAALFRDSGAEVLDVHRPSLEETTVQLLSTSTTGNDQ
jgi:ABC-2 type transport system ATP-binding protein